MRKLLTWSMLPQAYLACQQQNAKYFIKFDNFLVDTLFYILYNTLMILNKQLNFILLTIEERVLATIKNWRKGVQVSSKDMQNRILALHKEIAKRKRKYIVWKDVVSKILTEIGYDKFINSLGQGRDRVYLWKSGQVRPTYNSQKAIIEVLKEYELLNFIYR